MKCKNDAKYNFLKHLLFETKVASLHSPTTKKRCPNEHLSVYFIFAFANSINFHCGIS